MEWELDVQPIGTVRSCFPCKNGTPRQPTIASNARGQLKISKGIYNNPEHALEGLQDFSHVWLIFVFHKNKSGKFAKAKVSPPRMNGGRMGVFATRSPYRLNPIGLSLVKLESVEGDTLHFSGHDLVDGTPVLDIKPYIREYDSPSDRPCARASSSAQSVEDPLLTEDVIQPPPDERRPVDSTGPTETLRSRKADDAPRLRDARQKPLPHAGDVDRLRKDSGAAGEAWTEEGASQRHSGRQLVKNHNATISDLPNSQAVESLQERSTTDTRVSNPHTASPASAKDSPVPCDPSPGKGSGDTWLSRLCPEQWTVSFTAWAESQLQRFSASEEADSYRLRWLRDAAELRGALEELLTADPRSVYRRAQNDQLLYHLALDASHVTCWFDPSRRVIEVLRLQPLAESPLANVTAKAAGKDRGKTATVGESGGDTR